MINFDKQIQEEIDYIKFQIKFLSEGKEIQEDIEDKDPIIEAFQKDKISKKIECYKEAIELFEKAIKLEGNPSNHKERNNLIREALLVDLKADTMGLYYSERDVYMKEEFENFKNDFK